MKSDPAMDIVKLYREFQELKVENKLLRNSLNNEEGINEELRSLKKSLYRADLKHANLSHKELRYSDLRKANLYKANLRGADLTGAFLCEANLNGADLEDANITNANFEGANLIGVKNLPYIPMVCPEEGEFIGWKKASGLIVKLFIPAESARSSGTTRRCKCNKAKVLEIYNLDGTVAEARVASSDHDPNFLYQVGLWVEVKDYDPERWDDATRGIHFFMQRQEAINYNL